MTPAPEWATGVLVPLAPSHAPQRGPRRFPPSHSLPPPDTLPYGWWTLADGSHVLFDRGYCPLWARTPQGVVTAADPTQWTEWVWQSWLYDDSNPPWRNKATRARCEAVLARWGVAEIKGPPLGGGPGGGRQRGHSISNLEE